MYIFLVIIKRLVSASVLLLLVCTIVHAVTGAAPYLLLPTHCIETCSVKKDVEIVLFLTRSKEC